MIQLWFTDTGAFKATFSAGSFKSNIDQSEPSQYVSMVETMKINSRASNEVTILDIDGRITLGDDIAIFKQSIGALIAGGRKRVLLNLREVPYIDSSGIGELVSAFTKIRNSGGELKLLNLAPKVRTLLEITRLYTVFDVREDEAAAIHSFATAATSEL